MSLRAGFLQRLVMSPWMTWKAQSRETPRQASRGYFSRWGSSDAQTGPPGKTRGRGWLSGATSAQLFTKDPVCPVWWVRTLLMDGGQVSARHGTGRKPQLGPAFLPPALHIPTLELSFGTGQWSRFGRAGLTPPLGDAGHWVLQLCLRT